MNSNTLVDRCFKFQNIQRTAQNSLHCKNRGFWKIETDFSRGIMIRYLMYTTTHIFICMYIFFNKEKGLRMSYDPMKFAEKSKNGF